MKNRAQTSLCRLGLAIPLALGIMGGATLAGANTRSLPLDSNFPGTPAAGNAAGKSTTAEKTPPLTTTAGSAAVWTASSASSVG